MPQPNVLILRAPGTNCDLETAFAFEKAGGKAELLHINRLLENPGLFERFQILCIPGGFSYGDDVAAGRILGNQIQHHLAEQMTRFQAEGKLILGICNGFQVLIRLGVLLDRDPPQAPPVTLTCNGSGKFEDRWVRLDVQGAKCVFLSGIDSMYLPVAHAEGKFVARDEDVLSRLGDNGQLVLRYLPLDGQDRRGEKARSSCDRDFGVSCQVPYPDNPNGSVADVAGICDATGRVLGLMPHPERHVDPTHHPRWTRGEAGQLGDGLQVFVNAVRYFA
ncbi:MAG: phosphoribosylformylglycinamidine synthase subunit PurQ [Pirellulales bacterium]|nr:phosphoribosylformylglycinamidine synthase subunit PurQ [Pirellulales bacterium]